MHAPVQVCFWAVETDVPNHDTRPASRGLPYQQRNRVSVQSCFEYMIAVLLDRRLQQIAAGLPGEAVRPRLRQARITRAQHSRPIVRIEIVTAALAHVLADDAAFPGAVGARDDGQYGDVVTHRV